MSRTLFFLIHTAALAGMLALEFAPNKYLANAFVLVKTVVGLEAVMVWVMIGTFASKLPSPATINSALSITRSEKRTRWERVTSRVARVQAWAVTVVALVVGQWYVMFAVFLFLCGMLKIKSSAEKYLRGMRIDISAKTAVIDV